jgi:hypothetical protein
LFHNFTHMQAEHFPLCAHAGNLLHCMDIAVRTGSTKAPRDLSLVPLKMESLQGEHVCLLMEITAREKEAQAIERECELIVKHAILEAEGDSAEKLDGALKELNGLMKGMLVSGAVHDAHMIVSILDKEGNLHVSHAGRAEAYLIRRNAASQITEYSAGKPTPAFIHIASGKLEKDDLVILSTQRLLRTLTPAQLARLTTDRDMVLESVIRAMEGEGEHAAISTITVAGNLVAQEEEMIAPLPERVRATARNPIADRRQRLQASSLADRMPSMSFLNKLSLPSPAFLNGLLAKLPSMGQLTTMGKGTSKRGATTAASSAVALGTFWKNLQKSSRIFIADLSHPQRKKRAHLLLIAGALAALVVVWATVHLFTSSQRSKTRGELETLVGQINVEIQTAENKHLTGDTDAANAILLRAEQRAKTVMDNESGLFRVEANELLKRIRDKKEEINNIIRLTPTPSADLTDANPDILARGMIGLGDSEFLVYDKQDAYRVLLKTVESGNRLSDDVLVIDGTNLDRFQSQVFLMNGNSVVEWQNGQAISMKTDDANGWMAGTAISAYLRFIYILSPEAKQIYKYERLNGKYGAPVGYNVNGDLAGAIDIAIDGSVYVLKHTDQGGKILKLLRGESQNFVIRNLPPESLDTATKIFKIVDRNFYILDPENNRVIVVTDGGPTGESTYVRQYVMEGENLGTLQDLYVDDDESQLYVMDEKGIYVVDLTGR